MATDAKLLNFFKLWKNKEEEDIEIFIKVKTTKNILLRYIQKKQKI